MPPVLSDIPLVLPQVTRRILSTLLQEIQPGSDGSLDTPENQQSALKYAVALFLPKFAGTMLKFLREQPYPVENLLSVAAGFQGEDANAFAARQRLNMAIEYLLNTGCIEREGNQVAITSFGRQVFEARFNPKD